MTTADRVRERASTWQAQELRPAVLATSALSGLLIYLLEVILGVSFAALIFSGPLARHLPNALAMILLGNAVVVGLVAVFSGYRGSIAAAQDAPSAVMGLAAAALAAAWPAAAAADQFATAMLMIVVTTAMTGALFLALGVFKLGGLVRFLPYPVMGGFLAGTGWLLVRGGVGIMADAPFGPDLLSRPVVVQWLPGVLLGIVLFAAAARLRRSLVLPALLALATVIFYSVAAALRVPVAQLAAQGWLVGAMPAGSRAAFPLSAAMLAAVDWRLLAAQLPSLAPAAVISVIALLLNAGGLELLLRRDIDLNRELVVAGAANLAGGALGAMPGYTAISLSSLNHQLSGGKRLVGLVAALLLAASAVLGASLIGYLPKFILGAVLVYLGVTLLVEWVYAAWSKFPKIDFAIIVTILGVIALRGFLSGVAVGLVLAVILFVISYSRVSVVRFALSGEDYRSRVTRSLRQRQCLDREGDQLYLLKLQGFVFFGTAHGIFTQVREHIERWPGCPVRFVVLDFAQVTGLDSTGLLSFTRMRQWSQERGLVLVLTGLSGRARQQFERGDFREQPGRLRFFADLDQGIEWCEDQVLAEAGLGEPDGGDLAALFAIIIGPHPGLARLARYWQRREHAPGDYLIRQGDEPDVMYFVESGQVTARLEVPGQPPVRLETMGSGRSVGELGFYLGIPRTAAVIVDEPSVIYAMSRQDLAAMETADPEAAHALHRIVVHLLGERVVHLMRAVDALER